MSVLESGLPVDATANGSSSAAPNLVKPSGKKLYLTHISCGSDKANAKLVVDVDGSTIWETRISNTCNNEIEFIPPRRIDGTTVTATVDGTSYCAASIQGVQL